MDEQTKIIGRFSGAVLLTFGAGLCGLSVFATQRLFELSRLAKLSSVVGVASIGLIALFCLVVGYRLAFDRPNRYQSILPPLVWYALALLFVVGAFAAAFALLRADRYAALGIVVLIYVMAAGCLKAGRRAALRGAADPGLADDNSHATENAPTIGQPQGWRIGTLGGTTLFVHWSLPAGGLMVSAISGLAFPDAIYYCLAYTVLIILHEGGHFIAARAFGLQVSKVEISGLGGMCFIQAPRTVKEALVVFSAGLAVQMAILLLTILSVSVFGAPMSELGQCAFRTFTFVNAAILILNIIPAKVRWGFANDGLVLWRLFLHVWKDRPYPFSPNFKETILFPPDTRLHLLEGFSRAGVTTGLEILNDATTPMEFVGAVLMTHLDMDREGATAMILDIHRNGGVLVPVDDVARSAAIAAAITSDAHEQGHQFVCKAFNVIAAMSEQGTGPG